MNYHFIRKRRTNSKEKWHKRLCAVPSPPQALRNVKNVCTIKAYALHFVAVARCIGEVVVRNGLSQI